MKRIKAFLLMIGFVMTVLMQSGLPVYAEEPSAALNVSAPSSVLVEASTGQIIYENNADAKLRPASVTKIMTMLLIFDALEEGKIKLVDEVVTSEHAKSMGGSQVFLEQGEIQTVNTLIKCIAVASGNDASVAMAEYIAGSEVEFVSLMNKRAQSLGMSNTHFEDCCGLTESENHYTTARDVAVMSRELITKYPEVHKYTSIWMEDITHNTAKGAANFTLASTNKLLKLYPYTTGLKTGSTSLAKYCLSATARKEGIELVAVVLAAPSSKERFQDAMTLLNYGYSVSQIYVDENKDTLPPLQVKKGVKQSVPVTYEGTYRYLDITGKNLAGVSKNVVMLEDIEAPIKKGQVAGNATYSLDGKELGKMNIVFSEAVAKAVYKDYLAIIASKYLL